MTKAQCYFLTVHCQTQLFSSLDTNYSRMTSWLHYSWI